MPFAFVAFYCFHILKIFVQVEEKPDVTYSDVGGCKDSIEKLREVVELPLLHPERFARLGIDPPKGILLSVYFIP